MNTTAIGLITSTSTSASTWNGGVCSTCGARFLGSHYKCSPADLLARAGELIRLAREASMPPQPCAQFDRMKSCPCRPENGGSGVCSCILSGPQVTCR